MDRDSALGRTLVRNFITFNPMFLISACLALVGAWLANPPTTEPDVPLTIRLLVGLHGYQLALLGAAAVLARTGKNVRDVRNLTAVLVPFLLDVTCTGALLSDHAGGLAARAGLAVLLLGLAAGQGAVAARLAGRAFGAAGWTALGACGAVVALAPVATSALAAWGLASPGRGLALALAFAGATTLLAYASRDGARRGADAVRALAPLALALVAWRCVSVAWAHDAVSLVPAAVAFSSVAHAVPLFARDPSLRPWNTTLGLVTPIAAFAILDPSSVPFDQTLLALALVRAMGYAAAPWAPDALLALGLVRLSFGLGANPGLVGPDLVVTGGLCALAVLRRWSAPVTAGLALALAWALLAAGPAQLLHPMRWAAAAFDRALALQVVGGVVLAWTLRVHGLDRAGLWPRAVGAALLWAPVALLGANRGHPLAPASLALAHAGGLAVVALAWPARTWSFALPALALAAVDLRRLGGPSPAVLGALVLGLAFAAVGVGLAISLRRDALLAWLDRDTPPSADGPARPWRLVEAQAAPSAWTAVAFGGALAGLLAGHGAG